MDSRQLLVLMWRSIESAGGTPTINMALKLCRIAGGKMRQSDAYSILKPFRESYRVQSGYISGTENPSHGNNTGTTAIVPRAGAVKELVTKYNSTNVELQGGPGLFSEPLDPSALVVTSTRSRGAALLDAMWEQIESRVVKVTTRSAWYKQNCRAAKSMCEAGTTAEDITAAMALVHASSNAYLGGITKLAQLSSEWARIHNTNLVPFKARSPNFPMPGEKCPPLLILAELVDNVEAVG